MPVEDEGELVEGPPDPRRPRLRQWKKEDIAFAPLPDYVHPQPDFLMQPYEYFAKFFSLQLREHIVF